MVKVSQYNQNEQDSSGLYFFFNTFRYSEKK